MSPEKKKPKSQKKEVDDEEKERKAQEKKDKDEQKDLEKKAKEHLKKRLAKTNKASLNLLVALLLGIEFDMISHWSLLSLCLTWSGVDNHFIIPCHFGR